MFKRLLDFFDKMLILLICFFVFKVFDVFVVIVFWIFDLLFYEGIWV